MRLKALLLLSFCLFTCCLFGQNNYAIKGAAVDTDLRIKLVNTSIAVLNAKDSLLVNFTLAAPDGSFTVGHLPAGRFILLVTYPNYADYVETFTLDSLNKSHDFGTINLRLTTTVLHEVMIKGQVNAIKIKGDTTEFDAKKFVTQPNAKVEDLLKQFPGIQIDKNGKITANGEAVNKVLVDGEEFFGDDPTLVTKNIRADMVDKVQLYNKKSDQAAFTGIDDGKTTKTINIQLKDDKKNGAFGKLNAGVGTNGYYEGQGFYNKFKGKQKVSVYGTFANDGKVGLSFDDNSKLGSTGNGIEIVSDGIMFTSNSDDDLDSFDGTYQGKGLPRARAGGVHYDSKWNNDKESINFNYKLGSLQVNGNTLTETQQTLPAGLSKVNSGETFDNYGFRQKADVTYQLKIDTASNLKISSDGTIKTFNVNNAYQTQSSNNDTLVNRSNRNITNSGTQNIFNVSAFYTRKFKKPRRTFSWNVSEAYNNNQTNGYLKTETDYYGKSGLLDSAAKVNQYKTNKTANSVLKSNMAWSEPLSKYMSVIVNYGLEVNNANADKKSFDQSALNVYNVLDNTYSNNYQFNQLVNEVGAIFNYKRGKATINFGTKAGGVSFKQIDEYTGSVFKRDFINWTPQASLQYKIAKQKNFSIYYNGNNTQPTIDQIQPVKVNTDPLNITLGNPNLKPSFTNNIYTGYNSSEVISGNSLYINGRFSFTTDPIVNNTTTDYTTDKTTIQYVNLTNKTPYTYAFYISPRTKVESIDMSVGIDGSTEGNIAYSYINGQLNRSQTINYRGGLSFYKSEEEKYDFNASGGPSYTISQFSLQPQNNNNAPGFSINGGAEVYLPLKFIIASDINYNYTAKTSVLNANERAIMNASITKTFFKEKNLKTIIAVNNLFNQDVNFERNIVANTITQTTATGIRRYFMFSVSWDFTSFAAAVPKS